MRMNARAFGKSIHVVNGHDTGEFPLASQNLVAHQIRMNR